MSDPTHHQGLRIVVGLAGAGREQALMVALQDASVQIARCLDGAALRAAATVPTGAVIVEESLNRLTPTTVADLVRDGLPVFVLARETHRVEWEALGAAVLPLSAPAAEIVARVLAAAEHGPLPRHQGKAAPNRQAAPADPTDRGGADDEGQVVAVVAAADGVGCTMLSISLAAALGAVAETILFDADVAHPCIAAYLAADVLRSLSALREVPRGEEGWARALAGELQPLDEHLPRAHLLLGVTTPEPTPALTLRLFEDALLSLRRQARYIILDVGAAALAGGTSPLHVALTNADQVLVVARGDAVSLWQASVAAEQWRRTLGLPDERLAVVVNRHDRRYHPHQCAIGWATRLPVAAVIPEDHRQAQRAIAVQRPLVRVSRGRAARSLLALADRVHGGRIALPEVADGTARRWPLPWRRRPPRSGMEVTHGAPAIVG